MINVNVPIEVPDDLAVGTTANSIRILPDAGGEVLLDFCVFSAQAQRAVVVSRIRIQKGFLAVLFKKLATIVQPPSPPRIDANSGVLSDGRILLVKTPEEEN